MLNYIESNIIYTKYVPIRKTRMTFIITLPNGSEVKGELKKLRNRYNISEYMPRLLVSGKKESVNGYKIRKVYESIQ